MHNFRTLRQPLLGEKFVVVVCKPILVLGFDFGQAEHKCWIFFQEKYKPLDAAVHQKSCNPESWLMIMFENRDHSF